MVGMQYKITLPSDYDMQIIRKRVADNGSKTDGFPGLLFKCYLIQEKNVDGFENVYSPFYIWNDTKGMNKFLFEGYYDNVLKSFGWQNVLIGVPLSVDLKDNFIDSKFVIQEKNNITPQESLSAFQESITKSNESNDGITGRVYIYNPDKWTYCKFTFYTNRPETIGNSNIYQILHISKGV